MSDTENSKNIFDPKYIQPKIKQAANYYHELFVEKERKRDEFVLEVEQRLKKTNDFIKEKFFSTDLEKRVEELAKTNYQEHINTINAKHTKQIKEAQQLYKQDHPILHFFTGFLFLKQVKHQTSVWKMKEDYLFEAAMVISQELADSFKDDYFSIKIQRVRCVTTSFPPYWVLRGIKVFEKYQNDHYFIEAYPRSKTINDYRYQYPYQEKNDADFMAAEARIIDLSSNGVLLADRTMKLLRLSSVLNTKQENSNERS